MRIEALSQVEWAELMVRHCRANQDRSARPKFMTSANGSVISLYRRDSNFKKLLDQADGIDADGMPVVFASRMYARTPLPERVATTDFFHVAARFAERAGISFFLLGSAEEDNRAAAQYVRATYPRLKIAGRHHGYFTQAEEEELVQQVAAAKPDVLWVGMGVPREHEFIVRNRTRLVGVTWVKSCGGRSAWGTNRGDCSCATVALIPTRSTSSTSTAHSPVMPVGDGRLGPAELPERLGKEFERTELIR
jgi:exopolysaccharide biosynthesis WecB/TagA/CpsF family protein